MSMRGFFPFRILPEVLGPSRLSSSSNVAFRLCLCLDLLFLSRCWYLPTSGRHVCPRRAVAFVSVGEWLETGWRIRTCPLCQRGGCFRIPNPASISMRGFLPEVLGPSRLSSSSNVAFRFVLIFVSISCSCLVCIGLRQAVVFTLFSS